MPKKFTKRTGKKTLKKEIKSIVRSLEDKPEMKYASGVINSATVAGSTDYTIGNFTTPNIGGALDRGTQQNSRVGNTIMVHSLFVNVAISANIGQPTCISRTIIVLDKECEGRPFATSDLWQAPGVAGQTIFMHRNTYEKDQYRILYDKMVVHNNPNSLAAPTTAVFGAKVHRVRIHFKKPLKVSYYPNATTGGIADVLYGNLSIGFIGNIANAVFFGPCMYQINFTDA